MERPFPSVCAPSSCGTVIYRGHPWAAGVPSMVRIRDDGVFDAPIEKLWKYIQDNDNHQHRSFQVTKVLIQKGIAMTIEAKVANPAGGTESKKVVIPITPPKGVMLEYLLVQMKCRKQHHS